MSELHEKQPGETYFAEDFNDSFSYILDSMLRLGQDTGSFVSQVNAHFDLYSTATAGSVSTMTWATGSYTCNNALPLLCTIRTPVIYVNGSVTTAIAKWIGSYSSTTTVQHYLSLDNGTTWTQVTEGKLGSITPNTGSLMSELRLTRTGSNVRDNVTSVGLYYG